LEEEDLREDDPESEPEPSSSEPDSPLVSLPREEQEALLNSGTYFAISEFKKRKMEVSEERIETIVHDTYYKLLTTRRWDPAKGKVTTWFLGAIRSEISHLITGDKKEGRDQAAAEGFYREQQRPYIPSVEQVVDEADEEREGAAARRKDAASDAAELRIRLADHPLTPKVLACIGEGLEPAEIAARLNVPVAQVYAAIKLIKYHLARIREKRRGSHGDDES